MTTLISSINKFIQATFKLLGLGVSARLLLASERFVVRRGAFLGRRGGSWGLVGPSGASWALLRVPGASWGLLKLSGALLGPSGASWGFLSGLA